MIGQLIILFLINGLCLFVAGHLVPGFTVPLNLQELGIAALILTGLNLILLPVLRTVLKPLIWLTFGIASLAINAFMLVILDKVSEKVIISGVVPLVIGTLIITLTNAICRHLLLPKS